MGFSEKYQEYKQRKEAKAFFNQHNTEKVRGSDYLIAFAVGIAVTAFLNVLLISTGFSFMLLTVVIGIIQAQAIRRVLNKSGQQLAIISVITYFLGMVISQTLYSYLTLPINDFAIIFDLFLTYLRLLFTGDFRSLIIYLFGAIVSYLSIKD